MEALALIVSFIALIVSLINLVVSVGIGSFMYRVQKRREEAMAIVAPPQTSARVNPEPPGLVEVSGSRLTPT